MTSADGLPPTPAEAGVHLPTGVETSLSRPEIQRRAVSGALWTAIHATTSVPVAFAANAVVARLLGVASYGKLALLALALTLANQTSNAGVSDAVIQWGSAAEARGARSTATALLRKSLGFHLIVQLPALLLTVLLLGRGHGAGVMLVLVTGVTLPVLMASVSLSLTVENNTAAAAKVAMLSNLLLQLTLVALAASTRSAVWVWAGRTAAAGILLPLNLMIVDRRRWREVLAPLFPRGLPAGFWRYALQTCASGLVGMLVFSRSEIFFLSALGSKNDVGLYALAFGLAGQITAPVDALLGPLMPAAAGVLATAPGATARAVGRALRGSAVIAGMILAAVVPSLSVLIPSIYGSGFARAALVFIPMAALSCLQSCLNPLMAFANARRRSRFILKLNIAALVVDGVTAVVAIPRMGVWGAVVANLAGQLVVLAALAIAEASALALSVRLLLNDAGTWFFGLLAAGFSLLAVSWAEVSVLKAALGFSVGVFTFILLLRLSRTGLTANDWSALNAGSPRFLSGPFRLLRVVLGTARRPDKSLVISQMRT